MKYELNPVVKKQVEGGEPFDVVLVNPEFVAELIKLGKVGQGTGNGFGRIPMGVAVKAGASKPDLSSVEAFKRSLLAAKSVAYAGEGSSGIYFTGLLEKLGIAPAMKDKLKSVGGLTGQVVANGEAELGVVPVTTILAAAPGADLAGLFPQELQSYIDISVGISSSTKQNVASKALVAFLLSTDVEPAMKRRGIDRLK